MAPDEHTLAADADVIAALRPVRRLLVAEKKAREEQGRREKRARRRSVLLAAAALALAGFISTAVALGVVNRASARRAVANCEAINRPNAGSRQLWTGILALAAESDRFYGPEERAQRAMARDQARRLVDEAYVIEDCSTRKRT